VANSSSFSKNDGLQNQSVYYIQKGLGRRAGFVCLTRTSFPLTARRNWEGFRCQTAESMSLMESRRAVSDWRDFYVLDVGTRKPLTDHLEWVKFSGASWIGDQGFLLQPLSRPESGKKMGREDYTRFTTTSRYAAIRRQNDLREQRFTRNAVRESASRTRPTLCGILSVSDSIAGKRGDALFFRELGRTTNRSFRHRGRDCDDSYGADSTTSTANSLIETKSRALPTAKYCFLRSADQRFGKHSA